MNLRSPLLRVAAGLVMLTLTLLLVADTLFGLSSEGMRPQLAARKQLAEALAVQYSELAGREDFDAMQRAMALLVERNPEVLSTAIRRKGGDILTEAGDHRRHWRGAPPLESTSTHARVPIFDGTRRWGTLELRFTDLGTDSFVAFFATAWFKVLTFIVLVGAGAYFLYMRRSLRHLDPSAVIPARVKAAFDVLAEGVVFVDADGRIVLANTKFAEVTGRPMQQLMGLALADLGWAGSARSAAAVETLPWLRCVETARSQTGAALVLETGPDGCRELTVNAAPVLDDQKQARGAIVTFDDVTELERKKKELEDAVAELRDSRDQVKRQNEKLEIMATRDPLTNCLNRRSFVEILEREVDCARRDGTALSCIMLDIDHFKGVNDTFGHQVGDAAIRYAAGVASECCRGFDIVCRYGGEEFCVLLPTADADAAFRVAERIRESVAGRAAAALPELRGRPLTVSLGVAALGGEGDGPMELVDRADGALYESKTAGRNRTTIAGAATRDAVSAA